MARPRPGFDFRRGNGRVHSGPLLELGQIPPSSRGGEAGRVQGGQAAAGAAPETDIALAAQGLAQDSSYTAKQGQYLAFIYYYTKIHGRAPSEADMQDYFRVSPPSVHQMVLSLEKLGFIERTPGQGRFAQTAVAPRAAAGSVVRE